MKRQLQELSFFDYPFYEIEGPCANQVRQDVLKYITNNFYDEEELTPQRNKIIRKVINQIVPDTRNDFGSYRGYSTSNVCKELSFEVIKEMEIFFYHSSSFLHQVIHRTANQTTSTQNVLLHNTSILLWYYNLSEKF